jgi:hypothetical protein
MGKAKRDWRVEAGRKGGRSTSPAKLRAVRENARRGGRPRGVLVEVSQADFYKPLHLYFDRDTRDRIVALLLSISAPRVRVTMLRRPPKGVRIYAGPIGPKKAGRP